MDRAGEFIEGTAPQASDENLLVPSQVSTETGRNSGFLRVRIRCVLTTGEVASNLYDQGSRTGEYVVQERLSDILIAGVIGYTLGYLIHSAKN